MIGGVYRNDFILDQRDHLVTLGRNDLFRFQPGVFDGVGRNDFILGRCDLLDALGRNDFVLYLLQEPYYWRSIDRLNVFANLRNLFARLRISSADTSFMAFFSELRIEGGRERVTTFNIANGI